MENIKNMSEEMVKITGEKEVTYVNLDIEMSNETEQMLYDHAVKHILEDREAMINWAFIDALKKGIEKYKNMEENEGSTDPK